jgi:hypothetical protein
MRLTLTHQLQRHAHRSIWLATQRLGRTFVHADHFTGVMNLQTRAIDAGLASELFFDEGA